jgi:hypothetical protein
MFCNIGDTSVPADAAVLVGPGQFQVNFTVPRIAANWPEGEYALSVSIRLGNDTASSPASINSDPPGPVVLPIQH